MTIEKVSSNPVQVHRITRVRLLSLQARAHNCKHAHSTSYC